MEAPLLEGHAVDMASTITETALERDVLDDPQLRDGVNWGDPQARIFHTAEAA
jgi:hypothetical protein